MDNNRKTLNFKWSMAKVKATSKKYKMKREKKCIIGYYQMECDVAVAYVYYAQVQCVCQLKKRYQEKKKWKHIFIWLVSAITLSQAQKKTTVKRRLFYFSSMYSHQKFASTFSSMFDVRYSMFDVQQNHRTLT